VPLRLATYNVQHGRRPDGEVDHALLASSCAGLGADVLGLQEVDVGAARSNRADLAAVVAEACGMAVRFAPAIQLRGGGGYGNALLARGTITDEEILAFPEDSEPRCALLATVTTAGGPVLTVASTHLGLRGQAGPELERLVAALRDRPAPQVLLGDLNLEPPAVGPVVTAAGLTLAGGPPSWPAHRPRRRLDHVAVRGAVRTVEVVHLPVSDHRAVVVEADL
jgi:endonuclease/exonuclease/phosphatase family metal-dependent hydrolase